MNKIQKVVSALFLKDVEEPEGIEMVEFKCAEIIRTAEVGSPEFNAAYAQLDPAILGVY